MEVNNNNAALQATKEVAKRIALKAILSKLTIPLIILAFLSLIGIAIIAMFIAFISFVTKDEIKIGGWEVGEITEFGANEIPAQYLSLIHI